MDFAGATDRIGLPMQELAERLGRSYGTIMAYRSGQRRPPGEVWRQVAELAQERARELGELADELEATPRAGAPDG